MANTASRRKRYLLDQSPIYKLKSRRQLAALFDMPLNDLERLAKRPDNYRIFTIGKDKGKSRKVEAPKARLERVHLRLFHLLTRIQPPSYLHSGVKGRSYISNAKAHIGSSRLISLDIRKFFPSTLGWHVFEFFHEVMHCSKDVAGLLTALSTVENHVPTGSCLSQTIAFYAHYRMFEEICALTESLGLTMTCYVDDIAISGEKANRAALYKVRGVLRKRGLESPRKKEHVYDTGHPKVVTGSIVVNQGLRLPNRKHKNIHEESERILKLDDSDEKVKLLEVAIGRAVAGSQSDPALSQRVTALLQEKKRLTKLLAKANKSRITYSQE